MRELPATLYLGQRFDSNVAPLVPRDREILPSLWCYVTTDEYRTAVRRLDQKINVTNATLAKVPFDPEHWRGMAEKKYPGGLPKPHSDDPTQWLFNGHPRGSDVPLQVATARLLGYRWPRQTGSEFMDCPALGPDGLESHADDDGIVCLTPVRGEAAAEERLRALLAAAYGDEWSPGKQHELLAQVGYGGKSLDDWLRNGFFENHLEVFQNRPFVLHVWDGRIDGFNALVNYHLVAEPNGGGRRTLDKLAHTYLGDWIDRQRAEQRQGVEGADGRVAAAEHLKRELEKILEGEPPYDLFVRWKPLAEQPVGWEPDINDGVRINLRPFMTAKPLNLGGKKRAASACILRAAPNIKWDKDRGKEPTRAKDDYPWFWTWDGQSTDFQGGAEFDGNRWNDLHYKREVKLAARERAKGGKR
jgi:hypothetical protein